MDFMQIVDMLLHVEKYLGSLLDHYGALVYAVLFAIVFCETALVFMFFLPGDTLLFLGGAFCARGAMDIWLLMALLITAAVSGSSLNYGIGHLIGQRVFSHNYRWIDKDAVQKTHAFYERYGGITMVLSRFIPVVRTFAPFVAGVSEMTWTKFQLYNFGGAVFWVLLLVSSGFFFGNIPWVRDHLSMIVLFGVAVAVTPVALGVLWK